MAKPARKRSRTRKRAKSGWANDPFVDISPPWFRAAIAEAGSSIAALQRQLGEHEQTLSYHAKGDVMRRIRASRRAAIASALGVAEERLAGEAPFRLKRRFAESHGFSPRVWLATERLLTRADQAIARDLSRVPHSADEAVIAGGLLRPLLSDVLRSLTRLESWQARLLVLPPPHEGSLAVEQEAATLGLIAFLEQVLTPWFDARASLDYAALRALVTHTPTEHAPDHVVPSALLTADEPSTLETP